MDVRNGELQVWHDSPGNEARRQVALDDWSGHAEALHRIGLLDEEELREMLTYADAAYGRLAEE